ncbi:MAG: thiol oxidoreductase [Myxococcales bacterium]|nr:thiol oxidoreductase [Myxococcales bacterium]
MRRLLPTALAFAACTADETALIDASSRLPGGATTNTLLLGSNAFASPIENLLPEHEGDFFSGNSFFNAAWVSAPASTTARDGLGPLFNARSCSACHFKDGRAQPPANGEDHLGLLLRLSIPGTGPEGGPLGHATYGGQLQPFALPDVPAEGAITITNAEIPGTYSDGTPYTLLSPTYTIGDPAYGPLPDDLLVSPRVAPQMIGLGLLEAIDDSAIRATADPDDADNDGISGRVNEVWDQQAQALRLGRFGWKADQPSIRQQVAGAFLGDMGITSPVFPEEACSEPQTECRASATGGAPEIEPDAFDKTVLYSSVLAVPVRRRFGAADVVAGEAHFHDLGCATCHTPSWTTDVHPSLPELSNQRIWPYTDQLLHDMGDGLADGRPVFAADGREWKTPPLWGLGLVDDVNGHTRFLHDGRARSLAEAILWHGGEAEAAKQAFRAAPAADRDALIAFLESL